MFTLGIVCLIIALVAAVLGVGGVLVGTALTIAKWVFFIGIVIFIIDVIGGRTRWWK